MTTEKKDKIYNYEYWAVNGYKYLEERKENRNNKKIKIVSNIVVYFK